MLTIDRDRGDADDEIDVARALEEFDQLRAHLGATDCPEGHDQTEAQIDIAQSTMTFGRDDRFADDVRQVGADDEIPIQSDRAQSRAGDEASADAEEPAEQADEEADKNEIERVDVRAGDREMHRYSERPPCIIRRSRVVTHSSTTAWTMIRITAAKA